MPSDHVSIGGKIRKAFPGLVLKTDLPWKEISSLGVGGIVPLLAEPSDDIELSGLLKFCRDEDIQVLPLGCGTNIAGCDRPFPGLVIRFTGNDFARSKTGREHITVGAGVRLCECFREAATHGLGGAAPLAGIPGSLGGAVRMNAGTEGVTIGDFVVDICGFDYSGRPWYIDGREVRWGYRKSSIPDDVIITAVIMRLDKVDPDSELVKIDAVMGSRKDRTPSGRSAGCVFKNISPELPAGKLIDECGCKNMSEGGARVSDRHANYIVAESSGASEKDFLSLAMRIKEKVFNEKAVYLEPEIRFADPESLLKLKNFPVPLKVAVLKGGASSEREISLESGAAVADALRSAGYKVTELDIKHAGILPEMRVADVVFPVLHGGFGEDGTVQKLMEDAGIRFVGCGSSASAAALDKIRSKEIMLENGIPTPKYLAEIDQNAPFPEDLKLPLIVKPVSEGSTVGIAVVHNKDEWPDALEFAFRYDREHVIVEEFIKGIEATVGIVLDTALTPIEIRYPGELFDFDAKYEHRKGETLYLCPPESIPQDVQERIKDIGLKFYRAIGARDILRVDVIISDEDGSVQTLEANNIPGFTSSSLVPKSAKQDGIPFILLCGMLASAAYRRSI